MGLFKTFLEDPQLEHHKHRYKFLFSGLISKYQVNDILDHAGLQLHTIVGVNYDRSHGTWYALVDFDDPLTERQISMIQHKHGLTKFMEVPYKG